MKGFMRPDRIMEKRDRARVARRISGDRRLTQGLAGESLGELARLQAKMMAVVTNSVMARRQVAR
jgi:hypothetical protein